MSEHAGWRQSVGLGAPSPAGAAIWSMCALLVGGVVVGVIGLLVGGSAGTAVATVGLVFAICGVVAAPIAMVTGRAIQREVAGLLAGDALAHWHYTAEDLTAWAETERGYERGQTRILAILGTIFVVVGAGIGGLVGGAVAIGIGAGSGLALALLTLGLGSWSRRSNDLPHTDQTELPELYVGTAGIYQPGSHPRYVRLGGFGQRLQQVQARPGPLLVIVFTEQRRQVSSQGGSYTTTVTIQVGVPKGHEDEAQAVVAKFG